ncbi:MAG: NAD(P) transhydrogenase subunit alpha [Stackebrandtia sp.]
MTSKTIGALDESASGERRVALTPETAARLCGAGRRVLTESGAGARAWFSDEAYRAAGAEVVSRERVYAEADVLACVRPPTEESLREGQIVVGLLQPGLNAELIKDWARRGVTVVALESLPRKLSRAQSMDALTSQASVAGYKAAILAADTYGGFLPMLTTAAGTVKPASVLVLGAGVAGLQAIATAHRLGAAVTGYDIRPEAKTEITSLGARFLDIATPGDGSAEGGYARALTEAEREAQQQALSAAIARYDIVITAAGVPGRRPPAMVTEAALAGMRPGSVVVDTLSGPLGGNVAGSKPDETVTVDPGVTIVGAGNLPSLMPVAASTAYGRNISAVVAHLLPDDADDVDLDDEIADAIVIAHGGQLRDEQPATPATKGTAA